MTPETELVKALEQCLVTRIEKLDGELQALRHFVYCHCDHSGFYLPAVCDNCELVNFCWPPRDYANDFPEVKA